MVTRRGMKTAVAPAHRGFKLLGLRYVSFDTLKFRSTQPAQIAGRTDQRFDTMSPCYQLVDEIGANKSGCTGDKAFHKNVRTRESRARSMRVPMTPIIRPNAA